MSCRDDGVWRGLYEVRELVFVFPPDGTRLLVRGGEVVRLA